MPVDLNALPLKHAVSYLKITWTSSHHRCWIRCCASSIPRYVRRGNKLPSRAAGWGMERTGLKRGPAARLKKHIRRDFFQWMALDGVFTCLCTIQLVFLSFRSMVDQQPICWAGQPTESSTRFFIKPQNNAVLGLFWGRKHYGRDWSGEGGRQSKKIKKSWCAVATLAKQVQVFSGRRCAVDTHTSHTPQ